jgi:hypothetical protein
VPAGQEKPEGGLFGGLDLASEDREGRPSDAAQDVGIAPFPFDAARAELPADEEVARLEPGKERLDVLGRLRVARGERAGRERPARARVAEHDSLQGVRDRLEERLGKAPRRHHTERVAVEAGVLGRDRRLVNPDARTESAPLADERLGESGVQLAVAQIASAAEEVVQLVGVPRLRQQRALDLSERAGVDQVPELLLAEQLPEQLAVERERLRAPLGGGRVVLVHVGRHVVEEER